MSMIKHYKQFLLFLLLFTTDITCSAQHLNKFRLGVDFGFVIPNGPTDVIVGTEMKYHLNESSKLGLRIEGAGISKQIQPKNSSKITSESRVQVSFLSTYSFYYSIKEHWHSFVESGLGYYYLGDLSANELTDYTSRTFTPKFGSFLKTGLEIEKFRFTLGYYFIPDSKINLQSKSYTIKNSYVATTIGYFIGK